MPDRPFLLLWLAEQLEKTHDVIEPMRLLEPGDKPIGIANEYIQKLYTLAQRAENQLALLYSDPSEPLEQRRAIHYEHMTLTATVRSIRMLMCVALAEQFRNELKKKLPDEPALVSVELRHGFYVIPHIVTNSLLSAELAHNGIYLSFGTQDGSVPTA